MICKNCGAAITDESAVFCPNCGTPVGTANTEAQAASQPAGNNYQPDAQQGNSQPQPCPQPPYYQQPYPQANPNDKGGCLWGGLGFLIPVAGLILYFVWKREKPKTARALLIGAIVGIVVDIVCGIGFGILSGIVRYEIITRYGYLVIGAVL